MVASVLPRFSVVCLQVIHNLKPGFVDRYAGNSPFAGVNASLPLPVSRVRSGTGRAVSAPARRR
uniref:Uncharacterized protein n=1 Tax=Klebsiella pneumoniae TaxID=573 RepID=A0A2P1BPK3_KLEPN|nr:hypothetical protein [Klebsiella pneumoniae]